jgi:NAD(P)-dependent dehydrogenase (short-subunit alcohol dehydrogenase family)
VTSPESINTFSAYLTRTHGGVDVVFQNAAARITPDLPQREQVDTFIETNNLGTNRIIRAFRGLLNDHARFIVVASSFGSLRHLPEPLHAKFDVATKTLDDIEQVLSDYAAAVKDGSAEKQGWPEWINIPSKIGQVASMRIFARDFREDARRRNIMINAVCPGLLDTEASRPWFTNMEHAKQPDEAVDDLLWLANQQEWNEAAYGTMFQYRQEIPWNSQEP